MLKHRFNRADFNALAQSLVAAEEAPDFGRDLFAIRLCCRLSGSLSPSTFPFEDHLRELRELLFPRFGAAHGPAKYVYAAVCELVDPTLAQTFASDVKLNVNGPTDGAILPTSPAGLSAEKLEFLQNPVLERGAHPNERDRFAPTSKQGVVGVFVVSLLAQEVIVFVVDPHGWGDEGHAPDDDD